MTPQARREILDELAAEAGFDLWGVAPAGPIDHLAYFRRWLEAGRAGTMDYLHRWVEKRTDASQLIPGARSVIVCALNYHQQLPEPAEAPESGPRGKVAMYAWGDDYHKVVKRKLFRLADGLRGRIAEPFEARVCVDTAPLVEREYAMRAGIGWIGKNTMVLNGELGSYFFLGEIVTTLEFDFDQQAVDHCGSCTRCLEACPTQAFPAPYEMDASRCISYLTIENRAERIPEAFHRQIGDWVFGCDVCQEVCPYNRKSPETTEQRFAPRPPGPSPNVDEMIEWTDEQYREILAGSAMKRAKPYMHRRNARIVRRNQA